MRLRGEIAGPVVYGSKIWPAELPLDGAIDAEMRNAAPVYFSDAITEYLEANLALPNYQETGIGMYGEIGGTVDALQYFTANGLDALRAKAAELDTLWGMQSAQVSNNSTDTDADEIHAAAAPVTRFRVVVELADGTVRHCDPTDLADAYRVLGVALNSGGMGANIIVRPFGRLAHDDLNFSEVGGPAWVTTGGQLTTTPPSSPTVAFSLLIGHVLETDTLHIRIERAIELL